MERTRPRDEVPHGDVYFEAFRALAAGSADFPNARQLSQALHEDFGISDEDGGPLNEEDLRTYLPSPVREWHGAEQDDAAAERDRDAESEPAESEDPSRYEGSGPDHERDQAESPAEDGSGEPPQPQLPELSAEERYDRILEMVRKNPDMTGEEIGRVFGVSGRTGRRDKKEAEEQIMEEERAARSPLRAVSQ